MDAASRVFRTIDDLKTVSPDRFYSHKVLREEPNKSHSAWHLHEAIPTGEGQFPEIRQLFLQDCTRLQSLDWLPSFQNLELLWVYGSDKLANLEGIQCCKKLKSLTIWPSFSANITIDSLAPVAGLGDLEELVFSGKTRDGSLGFLASNQQLKDVFFSNSYSWEEIARFEAGHPGADFPWKGGVVHDANPTALKCKKCGHPQAMLSGKGLRLKCPQCDEASVKKHVDRYNKVVVG